MTLGHGQFTIKQHMFSDIQKQNISRLSIPIFGIACLFPFMSAGIALIGGALIAIAFGNPYPTKNYIHRLLAWSVIGLGAGMNLETVARVGIQGIGYTVVSIITVFILGFLLQKLLKVDSEVGLLITVGTAICGGSAIAAVTPVIRAKPSSVSVSLGTVFILNAIALLIFPPIGHALGLSQRAFGLWSALAIHDTSSVVGATVAYGKLAAEIGTTVKLARALWIVPVALLIGMWKKPDQSNNEAPSKAKKPWFILGFIIAAGVVTWIPALQEAGHLVEHVAKQLLVLTLFFIGLGLSRETLKEVGIKPLILGVGLWVLIAGGSLLAILNGVIH